jgi:hypothetical protein
VARAARINIDVGAVSRDFRQNQRGTGNDTQDLSLHGDAPQILADCAWQSGHRNDGLGDQPAKRLAFGCDSTDALLNPGRLVFGVSHNA